MASSSVRLKPCQLCLRKFALQVQKTWSRPVASLSFPRKQTIKRCENTGFVSSVRCKSALRNSKNQSLNKQRSSSQTVVKSEQSVISPAEPSSRTLFTKPEPQTQPQIQTDDSFNEGDLSVGPQFQLPDVNVDRYVGFSKQPFSSYRKERKPKIERRDWIQPEGLHTGISVYNSLTRKKEPLILPNGRLATWYACGPTVYDHAHIGHASSYVRTDIIRRIMMHMFNIDVVMVMGITDIDDKIIHRSQELKMDFRRMARQYEKEFFRDMGLLKVMPPTVRTHVTKHLPHIQQFIQRIMDNGYAYRTPQGSVYFDVQQYGRYGRLWTHSMDTEIREPADKEKRSARDFALWKAAKPSEPFWESPWGQGRPGWHIECSTMASAIFGEKLDIHSGGDDLRFPHHENEMAQSEACFCTNQWTNYWMHTGYLHLKNDSNKMSKSLKNTIPISRLLENYTANQFRIFCMLRPYRQLVEYSEASMLKAVSIYRGWTAFLQLAEAYIQGQLLCKPISEAHILQSLEEAKVKVEKALADDFDTPRAITALEELVHKVNIELGKKVHTESEASVRSPGAIAAVVAFVDRIMDMWGIQHARIKNFSQEETEQKLSDVMDSVVKFRSQVRQFALSPESAQQIVQSAQQENSPEMSEKEHKKLARQVMAPLMASCDELRDDLRVSGIQLQDHGKDSSWDILEKKRLPDGGDVKGAIKLKKTATETPSEPEKRDAVADAKKKKVPTATLR